MLSIVVQLNDKVDGTIYITNQSSKANLLLYDCYHRILLLCVNAITFQVQIYKTYHNSRGNCYMTSYFLVAKTMIDLF